jgi:hypothetical protein
MPSVAHIVAAQIPQACELVDLKKAVPMYDGGQESDKRNLSLEEV